jgi:hypothetical protein
MKARPTREKWSARRSELAVSFAISASWHFLVLAILAMAVHPLQLPNPDRPINLDLLPPLIPPPAIRIEPPPPPPLIQPKPILRRPIEIKPPAQVTPKLVDVQHPSEPVPPQPVAPQPLEAAHPLQPILRKPIEVERPPSPAPSKPLQVQRPSLTISPVPQEPLAVARPPQPVLPRPLEIERPSPIPPRAIVADRPAPPVLREAPLSEPAAAASVSPPQNTAALPVLTNQQVVQAPIEIRPPDRPAGSSLGAAAPAFPEFAPAGGAPPAGGGPAGGAQAAGGGGGGGAAGGRIVGFETGGGLRMTRGCLTPETYRLTPEERAACLNRVGAEAGGGRALEPNIPAGKQADYDRYEACHSRNSGGATPGSTAESATTGQIRGLGDNPRLRDCGPGDR